MSNIELLTGDDREHIARISYGKDSLKMLEVIHSRGLRLDRITTTDVWATDTVPAWLPPMDEFKARMDQRIWDMYRIQVEHLCARNKDGSKKTYEQLFYHVPVRRSQTVQVERERDKDRPEGLPQCRMDTLKGGLSQTELFLGVKSSNWFKETSKDSLCWVDLGAKAVLNQGFPATTSPWCRKLKIDKVKTPFPMSAPRGAEKEISWNTLVSLRTSLTALAS